MAKQDIPAPKASAAKTETKKNTLASQYAVVTVRKIGVDEVTGEHKFKPFDWTGLALDYEKFLALGQVRMSGGKRYGVFDSCLILEEKYVPEGCRTLADWKKENNVD